MPFTLFHRPQPNAPTDPATQEFCDLLDHLRQAVRVPGPLAGHAALVEYVRSSSWTVREREYGFITREFAALEKELGRPQHVLDVGCGVAPLGNWAARRGHAVTAVDPAATDIEFLKRSDLNGFHGTQVDYRVARGEELPFADATFDVVTCIAVLQHMVPGNDGVALREMARVLKPGGRLLLTFDVAPPRPPQHGEGPWPLNRRRHGAPFTAATAGRLLHEAAAAFATGPDDVPPSLAALTWDEVHAFWQQTQAHDGRDAPEREYLTAGHVLRRRADAAPLPASDRAHAYLEGQEALDERRQFYAGHSDQRLRTVEQLHQIAEERSRLVTHLSQVAEERLRVIDTVRAEHVRHISQLEEVIGQRQRDIDELKDVAKRQRARLARLRLKLRRRNDTEKYMRNVSNLVTLTHRRVEDEHQRRARTIRAFFGRRIDAVREKIKGRIKQFLTPQLGRLQQYPPRPLTIPEAYSKLPQLPEPPPISVVTPSFNQAVFLERTLKSVLDQNYPRLQYVVQDGGSSDDTRAILERYQDRLAHWESAKDRGQSHGINLGFRHATGEILAYLNSDDLLLPGALHYVAHYFVTHPEVDVVYGHRVVVNATEQEIGRWVMPPHDDAVLSWADFVPQETLFWRRSIWEKIGGHIDENFQFAMDWDLLLRFRDAGAKFARVPRFLAAFRVHEQQKTSAQMADVGLKEMDRLRQRCLGRPVSGEEVTQQIKPFLRRHVLFHKLYRMGVMGY